ncbi:MAG: putative DNA binding domain-containing protein [Anaerolineales bacterium]|nr:putative DNA binding domain-containing protein [Anaerolineales bacterium]
MSFRLRNQLTDEELHTILGAGQGQRNALLPAKASRQVIAETLAALANADGGVVVLGVNGRGQPQSGGEPQVLRDAVIDAGLAAEPPLILPSPQVVIVDGSTIVVVQVPAGLPHVYSLKGVYWTRTGAKNRPLTTAELRRLLVDRSESGFEGQPPPGAVLTDLEQARIARYLDQIGFPPDDDALEALVSRGCVTRLAVDGLPADEPAPTIAGVLLFGRDPQRFVRSAEIICVRYAGVVMGDEFVRQDLGGPLADQIKAG